MKVIFQHRVWPVYGGGETVTICLANEMLKRDVEVHVAYFKDSPEDKKRPYIDPRIKLHRIENVKFNEYSGDFFINKKEARYVSTELIKIVNDYHIDIVHNQWWPMEFVSGIHENTSAKIVKCLHMDVDLKKAFEFTGAKRHILKMLYPAYRWIEQQKNLKRADKYYDGSDMFVFLAPCYQATYDNLRKGKIDKQRLDFVYNPQVYDTLITLEEYQNKEKIVLVVGRLSERHKKISRILEVWKLIEQDKRLEDWKLLVVGDGEDRSMYEQMISDLGLKNISLEGYQQPLEYYKRASVFFMTSAYEGFPMTLVEAQQNGVVPVAMDNFDTIHEIVQNGHNGCLLPSTDISAFYNEASNVMLNPDFRMSLAKNGLESCQRFGITNIVDKWLSIYNSLTQ